MPAACVWKRCPGCYFRWLDKYSFDECPKCLSQLSKVQEQEEVYASGASANMEPLWSLTTSQKMQRWSNTLRDTIHSGRTPRHNPSISTRSPNPKQQRRSSLRDTEQANTPQELGSFRCAWTAPSPTANSTAVGTPASVSTAAPADDRADCEALPASYVQAGSATAAATSRAQHSLKAEPRYPSAASSAAAKKDGGRTADEYEWDAPSYHSWHSHMERTMSMHQRAGPAGRGRRDDTSGEFHSKAQSHTHEQAAADRYSVLSAFAAPQAAAGAGGPNTPRSELAWAEELAIARADAAAARAEALAAQAQVASVMAEFKRLQALVPQLATLD